MKWNTMRDRIAYLGLPYPDKRTAWSLGSTLRAIYERETGALPRKALAEKTNAGGSHCFATYPEKFWPRMDEAIKRTLRSPQPLLPFPS
ncbi:MAG: hypothetical protein ACO3O1_05040 [Ilumatobacteraceae bacterium]